MKAVLAANDYYGGLKADLSCALAVFGEAEDVGLIRKLIDADIDRVQQGLELHRQGAPADPRAQGACTIWSNWHVRALRRLDPENADKYLLEFLNEPEYEEDAGRGLVQLLKRNVPKEKFPWGHEPLKIGSALQERDYIDAAKSKQYSSAIEKRIRNLIAERKKAGKPGWFGRLALILASIGEPSAIPLILEALQLPSQYGAWARVETLETLIKNGAELETTVVESVLDQVIKQLAKQGMHNNQNTFLLDRCLSILACTNQMDKAVARIKHLASTYRLDYGMRSVIGILGYTSSSEAANYLIELVQNPTMCHMLAPELLQALASMDTSESKNAIMSIVDATIKHSRLYLPSKVRGTHIVAKAIANWCRKDEQLKKRVFELCCKTLTESQRGVLADVIHELSTTDAVNAGLKIISAQSKNPVPSYLRQAIERSVTEHVPSEDFPSAYNIRPRENTVVRSKLFDMVYDDNARSNGAFNLLGFISRLRLEHGNPSMEPRHPNIDRREPWPPLARRSD